MRYQIGISIVPVWFMVVMPTLEASPRASIHDLLRKYFTLLRQIQILRGEDLVVVVVSAVALVVAEVVVGSW